MTQRQQFQAAAVAAQFKQVCARFDKLLASEDVEQFKAIRQKFQQEIKAYWDDGILKVAFVGQYSAGKSTIISALTGRRDIKIDADIATDKTTAYDWNGIKLIDTPGLFTERADHDDITYDAIAKSDLLVFCLTYMLFDSITVENFKKLAYDKGYRWKMMLVINKMSDEAGEEDEKIANYQQSLAEALKPHNLEEFPLCFIDAKDYCEGIDETDEFLLEISRFDSFIDSLNHFVKHRASLARFDTPVRIALTCVDETQLAWKRNSNEDSAFFELLNQLSRKVRNERSRLRTKVKSIALRMSSAIIQEGTPLATAVGTDLDFKQLNHKAELNVQRHYEKAEAEMQVVIDAAVEDIKCEIEQVLNSDLVRAFVACLDKDKTVSARNASSGLHVEELKKQVTWIKQIGETAGVKLIDLATRNFAGTASQQVFLRSIDVAGSGLHQGVLAVGKFVGFKFKPWQAVGIAKNIGNAAKFLGPALALVSVGVDVLSMHQESQQEQKMADVRREITSQFQVFAKDLENQLDFQRYEFEAQVYDEIEKQIAAARRQEEDAIASSDTRMKELAQIRRDYEAILDGISQTFH